MGTAIWRSFCLVFKGKLSGSQAGLELLICLPPPLECWEFFRRRISQVWCGTCPKFLALGGWGWKVQAKLAWTTQKNKQNLLFRRKVTLSTPTSKLRFHLVLKVQESSYFHTGTVYGCYMLRAQCGLSGPGCKEQYNYNNNLQANNLPPNSGLPWKFPKASQSNYRVDRQGPWPAMNTALPVSCFLQNRK